MVILELQLQKLNALLGEVWERNLFYTHKWCQAGVAQYQLESLDQLTRLPLTTRDELLADQSMRPPWGTNLTYPPAEFKRIHRSAEPPPSALYWADTPRSWRWVMDCCQRLFRWVGVTPDDRLFFVMPCQFTSGAWTLYESACRMGWCVFTAHQTELEPQVSWLVQFRPTILVGKPSRMLALADAVDTCGIRANTLGAQKVILIGESSLPHLRPVIERRWHAECFDHYELTEAGSVATECPAHYGGMHVLEEEFIVEVIDPDTAETVVDGRMGELVLTNLGRWGRPLIRYRTGDLVRLVRDHGCPCGRPDAMLMGGVRRPTGRSQAGMTAPPSL